MEYTGPKCGAGAAQAELQMRLVTEVALVKKLLEETIEGRAEIKYSSEHGPVRLLEVPGSICVSSGLRQTSVSFAVGTGSIAWPWFDP